MDDTRQLATAMLGLVAAAIMLVAGLQYLPDRGDHLMLPSQTAMATQVERHSGPQTMSARPTNKQASIAR